MKSPTFCFRGHFLGTINASNGNFKPKHPVEQLFTRSTDSHLQYTDRFSPTSGKKQGIIRNFPNSIYGEQSGTFQKISSLNSYSTVRPIFANNILVDSSH
jgi:hypothetical protein